MNLHRLTCYLFTFAFLGCIAASHAQAGDKKPSAKHGKDAIEFYIGDELVTRYLYGSTYPRPIFWPLNAPGGIPLTRAWPMEKGYPGEVTDHPHQKSAWFCHGDIVAEGMEVKNKIKGVAGIDFWSEAKGHGIIVSKLSALGKTGASITTANEWQTADGVKIMDETRKIQLHDLGNARLIVVDIDLHASVCKITFADTKEGAFGTRVTEVLNEDKRGKGKIQNAAGKVGEKECWGQISNWCDYSGPVSDKLVGLTVLADPKNTYPSCWHVRAYGLMAANPFGREAHAKFPAMTGNNDPVRLDKGQHLRLRYGMLLHTGDANTGQVAEHYRRFVQLRDKE